MIVAQMEVVTPEIAKRWLSTSPGNRKIRKNYVQALCRAMVSGAFSRTGDTVKFLADGSLIDGHHRLEAIIASGVTVELLVARGVAAESIPDIDRGQSRSLADVLHFAKVPSGRHVSGVTRALFLMEHGVFFAKNGLVFAAPDMSDILDRWPQAVEPLGFTANPHRSVIKSPTMIHAIALWLLHRGGMDAWDAAKEILTGEGIAPDSPVAALARYRGLVHGRGEAHVQRYLAAKVMLAHARGHEIRHLKWFTGNPPGWPLSAVDRAH